MCGLLIVVVVVVVGGGGVVRKAMDLKKVKQHELPLARVKKIMKSDPDVKVRYCHVKSCHVMRCGDVVLS